MRIFDSLRHKIDYFFNVVIRGMPHHYDIKYGINNKRNPEVIGMIRERNEALLLKDTLDHLTGVVDSVVIFDDASTDDSVEIALAHPLVAKVIINKRWLANRRRWEETANRRVLYHHAEKYNPVWFFYCDADERFEGDIRHFLLENKTTPVKGVRISLLDAYITKGDEAPYAQGDRLLNFRDKFGIERRDILMCWRHDSGAKYVRPDSREPAGIADANIVTRFWCQHYGKAVSIEQWEDTCRYYADNFPEYSAKWRARMGRAVHEVSDFDTPLYPWVVAREKSKKIH